jgi:hypothetical protein
MLLIIPVEQIATVLRQAGDEYNSHECVVRFNRGPNSPSNDLRLRTIDYSLNLGTRSNPVFYGPPPGCGGNRNCEPSRKPIV